MNHCQRINLRYQQYTDTTSMHSPAFALVAATAVASRGSLVRAEAVAGDFMVNDITENRRLRGNADVQKERRLGGWPDLKTIVANKADKAKAQEVVSAAGVGTPSSQRLSKKKGKEKVENVSSAPQASDEDPYDIINVEKFAAVFDNWWGLRQRIPPKGVKANNKAVEPN